MNADLNQLILAGSPVEEASKALVMIHGRGGSAKDIISLMPELKLSNAFAVVAPQAPNSSWYPNSFMAEQMLNQPALDQSLAIIGEAVQRLNASGIKNEDIYFLGFSQGACLTLEYVARNAKQYGGVIAFTGGLIGAKLNKSRYTGNFFGTKILITAGVPDPHVPLTRIEESERMFMAMEASITVKTFQGKSHGIALNEIELANSLILG